MDLERRMLEGEHITNSCWKSMTPLLTGDSTPAVPGFSTPYEQEASTNVHHEEGVDETRAEEVMAGQIVGNKEILKKPLTRRMMRRQKHKQRLERRYLRAVRGHKKQDSRKGSRKHKDYAEPLSGTGLVRARPARPCSYCHVPYHHKVCVCLNTMYIFM